MSNLIRIHFNRASANAAITGLRLSCPKCNARNGWIAAVPLHDPKYCRYCAGTCISPLPFTEILNDDAK